MGGAMAMSFCRRMIQPIKDRVQPVFEYWGQTDPTRKVGRKISREEMTTRVGTMYIGRPWNKNCPKAYSLKRPADPVST